MKSHLAALAGVLLLAAPPAAFAQAGSKGVVKVGVLLPLTGNTAWAGKTNRIAAAIEPSLGLAPLVVESVHQAIDRIRREMGIGGILVEQNVAVGLSVAARAYVLMRGSVVLEGDPKDLAASRQMKDAYLGMASEPPSAEVKQGHHD
jgi:ABC-type uncharacterized transport system ATPase subunit